MILFAIVSIFFCKFFVPPLSVCVPVRLSVCLPACLIVCLPACLSVYLSVCPSVRPSVAVCLSGRWDVDQTSICQHEAAAQLPIGDAREGAPAAFFGGYLWVLLCRPKPFKGSIQSPQDSRRWSLQKGHLLKGPI